MSTTSTQPSAYVRFTSTQAPSALELSEVARALGVVQRLAAARSRAWCSGQPTRDLTARLEVAWEQVRVARAVISPHRPPGGAPSTSWPIAHPRHRVDDDPLDGFLREGVRHDARSRVALPDLARALRAYVDDPAERADLPDRWALARRLRERGLTVERRGGVIYAAGIRLRDQDRNGYSPRATSDSSTRSDSTRERPSETAMSQRRGR